MTNADNGLAEITMEEAMISFFYDGVNKLVTDSGYKWIDNEDVIARKFVYLCYSIHQTLEAGSKYSLEVPVPKHRNYEEDRETFDLFLDTGLFIDLLDAWYFREEIVGTRLDYLIKEFCYVWIDVTSGKPGTFTQKLLTAEEEDVNEDEFNSVPDTWSKKKWDLY
jgi:hypothetical protein